MRVVLVNAIVALIYSFYDMSSGLPYITTANSRSYLSSDGTLYLSGSASVSSININKAGDDGADVRLIIPFVAELKRVAGTQLNEEYVQVLLTLIEEGKLGF